MSEIDLVFYTPDHNEYRFPIQEWSTTPIIGDCVRILDVDDGGDEVEIYARVTEREWTFQDNDAPVLWIALVAMEE